VGFSAFSLTEGFSSAVGIGGAFFASSFFAGIEGASLPSFFSSAAEGAALVPSSSEKVIKTAPTGTRSPSLNPSFSTFPLIGEGIVTRALSVSTSTTS
jgi:hypothetical protein